MGSMLLDAGEVIGGDTEEVPSPVGFAVGGALGVGETNFFVIHQMPLVSSILEYCVSSSCGLDDSRHTTSCP